MKIDINVGHTNKNKIIKDNKIIIYKTYTGFNHKLDYKVTQEFNFVPKLISDNKEKTEWELLDGEMLDKPTSEELKSLGIIIRKIHKSNLKLPKNNLRQRVKFYLRTIHDKYIKVDEIENNWKSMNKVITKMNNINPTHNDIWWQNIIKTNDNKIMLVDWEYATMGDKHFDLAFYIESNSLTKEEEEIFLDSYNSIDDYNAYISQWMNKYKMFVNWLTLLWAYSQDEMPFDTIDIKKRINYLSKII